MNENSIKIRPLEEEDLKKSNWLKWLADYETTKYQDLGYFPQNFNRQIGYLNSKLISNKDILFAVEYKKKNDSFVHVGNVGLHSIDLIHRRCTLGIIIGEKEYRGKGIGTFSWKFITKHAFEMLNLRKVYAYIFEDNINSRKCAEKSGYIQECKLLDYYYRNGRYQNCIVYSKSNNL